MTKRAKGLILRAIGFAGIVGCLGVSEARAQTELSLQESAINITADHSSNVTVDLHLDSLGPNTAVYGVVGKPGMQGPPAPAGPVGARIPAAPQVVQSQVAIDWAEPHVANELIICFDQQWMGGARSANPNLVMRRQKNTLHDRMKTRLRKELRLINADVITIPRGADIQDIARRYAQMPGVSYVQPNYLLKAVGLPDDPRFPNVPSSLPAPGDQIMWGLHTTAQNGSPIPSDTHFDSDIDAAEAWEVSTGSNNVIVAVIDTGVDYNHPDIAANMWTNPGEINGNGIDDDGNGYVDDYYGYDFENNDGDPFDDHYHGTHCAGTVGAVGDNGIDVAGVNWNVKIMALKFLDAGGFGDTVNAIDCVDYADMMGAMISSNSWGGGGYNAGLRSAIEAAGLNGHLFIAAAGNDADNADITPHYPAAYDLDNIMSIAAWDKNEQLASFSTYGATTVDLAAPGVGIWSLQDGGGIQPLNGTSMATPHVSGVAALLQGLRSDADGLQIKQWIMDGVTPHPNLTGRCVTGGRLNAVEPIRLATMPWLEIANREGMMLSSTTQTIPVTFRTDQVPVGAYTGSIVVLDMSYDTVVTPRIEIPVSMDLQFVELAPIVSDTFQYVVQGFDTTIVLDGYDPNYGQTVDFVIESLPALGTLIDPSTSQPITAVPHALASNTKEVIYSPGPGFYTEYFEFSATDGTTSSGNGEVEVEVVDRPQPPQDLTATAGSTTVALNWLPNIEPGLVGYNVFTSTDPGGPYGKVTPTPNTSTSYEHIPGGPITTYYVVTAVLNNGAESLYSAEASATPTYVNPYTPANLRGTAGDEKVYLDWEKPQYFNGTYRIIRTDMSTGQGQIIAEISDYDITEYLDPDPQTQQYGNPPENGTTYEYVVENYTYWDLWGSSSNVITVTPDDETPPAAPTGVTAVAGEGFVDVTWDANTELDIDEYWVARSTTSGSGYYLVAAVNDRRYYDTNIIPNTTYYYVIIATDFDGDESEFSAEASGTPTGETDPPAVPTNLTANVVNNYVFLDWDDNTEPDFREYTIYRSETAGGPYEDWDSDDVSEYVDAPTPGVTYYYVVTAVDNFGNESGYSNEVSALVVSPPPAAPTNLVGYAGNGQVLLDWDDNSESNLVGYYIYQSTTSGGPYFEVDNDDPSTFTVGGLANDTTYYFVVSAFNTSGDESGYSNEVEVTPSASASPAATPANLVGLPTNNAAYMRWEPVTGQNIRYRLYRSTTSGGPYTLATETSSIAYWNSGLTNGVTYYFRIASVDIFNAESPLSDEVAVLVNPDVTPPAPPANVAAVSNDTSITLSWDQNTEPDYDEYSIYRSTTSGGPYGDLDEDDTTTFTDNSVTVGVTYYYVITARDIWGNESAYSAEVSGTAGGCIDDSDCDDGAYCNGAETCVGGVCQPGGGVNCDDGVSCTSDSCNEATDSCDNTPQDGLCTDQDFCTGVETCDAVLGCQSGSDPCPGQLCDSENEVCVDCLVDADCDDAAYCNGAETCVAGSCQPGTAISCDDGVSCTDDSCNEGTDSCDNVANNGNCDDGLYCNGSETCDAVLDCVVGTDPCPGQTCNEATDQCEGATARLETGTVTVGGSHVTVGLQNTYLDPVVVCTVNYDNNSIPVVTRVSNVTGSSFDVRLQNPSNSSVASELVSYVVVEAGSWVIDGVAIDAQKYVSTMTAENNSWVSEIQSYGQPFSSPVVLGQVMTENDSDWSVFWCRGSSRNNPPNASNLRTGKTVCEDSDTSRADETIGFIVVEAGTGTIAGIEFEAGVTNDFVRGVTNNPPYSYSFDAPFSTAPEVAITTQAGMDGGDGGWAYAYGSSYTTASQIRLAIDEDQIGNNERNHTTEQVGYFVIESPVVYPGQ